MTTLERIDAALAHLAPRDPSDLERDDWELVRKAIESPWDYYNAAAREALDRLKASRDAAYRELFNAKIELMGRGEGTSMS